MNQRVPLSNGCTAFVREPLPCSLPSPGEPNNRSRRDGRDTSHCFATALRARCLDGERDRAGPTPFLCTRSGHTTGPSCSPVPVFLGERECGGEGNHDGISDARAGGSCGENPNRLSTYQRPPRAGLVVLDAGGGAGGVLRGRLPDDRGGLLRSRIRGRGLGGGDCGVSAAGGGGRDGRGVLRSHERDALRAGRLAPRPDSR